jgi:hypothetical protein
MSPPTRSWDQLQDKRITKNVRPYTLVSPQDIQDLCRLATRIEREHVPGDVMECGVCNGGTAAVLARFATHSTLNRTVWLLDSFQGMPEITLEDGVGVGGDPAETHVEKEFGDPARVNGLLRAARAAAGVPPSGGRCVGCSVHNTGDLPFPVVFGSIARSRVCEAIRVASGLIFRTVLRGKVQSHVRAAAALYLSNAVVLEKTQRG